MTQLDTDIFITTRNRLTYLTATLTHILSRTRSPYSLHIVDDMSTDGTVNYLLNLWHRKLISTLTLTNSLYGFRACHNLRLPLTFSDPFVVVDDDMLCPDVEPDWIARGLAAMEAHPKLGLLELNEPADVQAKKPKGRRKCDGDVCYCSRVEQHFTFIRRASVEGLVLPHVKGQGLRVSDHRGRPVKFPGVTTSKWVHRHGWDVGYLVDTYSHHIGEISTTGELEWELITPVDDKTLLPPEKLVF